MIREWFCILPRRPCARAKPRRKKLFSATDTRHRAYARGFEYRPAKRRSHSRSNTSTPSPERRMKEENALQDSLSQVGPIIAAAQVRQSCNRIAFELERRQLLQSPHWKKIAGFMKPTAAGTRTRSELQIVYLAGGAELFMVSRRRRIQAGWI